jgi:CHAT domain-containing protein
LALFLFGCSKQDVQPDWTKFYSQTKLAKETHQAVARGMIEKGLRETTFDPTLNYEFRLLKARDPSCDDPKQAASLLESAPPNSPERQKLEAGRAYARALVGACTGNFQSSHRELAEAKALAVSSDPELMANIANTEGWLASREKDSERASSLYLEALDIARRYHNPVEISTLNNLGLLLAQGKFYDQAIECFSKVRKLATVWHDPLMEEEALGNLGVWYGELGDWENAITYTKEAIVKSSTITGTPKADSDYALWLNNLGRLHFWNQQYQEAQKDWQKALAVAQRANDIRSLTMTLANLAWGASKTGDIATAKNYLQEDEKLHPQGEEKVTYYLNKAEVAAAEHDLQNAKTDLAIALASQPSVGHRWQALSDLAGIYTEEKRLAEAERTFKKAINSTEHAFDEIASSRFQISFFDQNPFFDDFVRFLVTQGRAADALEIAERGRSRALARAFGLTGNDHLNIGRIQSSLRDKKQVVLAYWLGYKESYLWVITPSQFKLLKLPSENEIVKEVDAYNHDILEHSAQDSPHGEKLYLMLVAPARRFVPKGSNVIIVPHRRLFKLDFETLIAPSPKPHYWIEDVCIQNTSFLAALEDPNGKPQKFSKQMLVMGAPEQASTDFPPLVHAPEELKQVEEHFPKAKETVISGAAATPEAYDSSDPAQFRFMHFVTHGTASDMNPLDSAIILSPSPEGFKLYARDIIKTKIHPELVTISTCYGAGTRQYSGEGLVGLAWAFMRAGAHQVIGALWEVDDAANAELMDHFYTALARTGRPAAALHEAKLAMLHSNTFHKRPYYWASLQLYTGR